MTTSRSLVGRREVSVVLVYALILVVLAVRAPGFYRPDAFRAYLVENASTLVAAVGMTLVILSRQIDISIGAQVGVAGVAAGLLARSGMPMVGVAAGAVAVGAALGLVNGLLVARAGLPSIVVTLATSFIWRESLRYGREGAPVDGLPPGFQWFGLGQGAGSAALIGIALAVTGLVAWGLGHLAIGRAVVATGSDPEASRLAGLRPGRVVVAVFAASGALAGLAAVLLSVRFAAVDPNAGNGLELPVIAAVVVGGTAVSGGRGSIVGTFLGVALLRTIGRALVFLGLGAEWEGAIQGAIILLAVAGDPRDRGRR